MVSLWSVERTHHTDPLGYSEERSLSLPGSGPRWRSWKKVDDKAYFDPGNEHYKNCFEMLFGRTDWNRETVGDIVESLLGMQYLIANTEEVFKEEPSHWVMFPTGFVTFLHDWCLAVHRYKQSTGWWTLSYSEICDRNTAV